jgi:predicted transcriptional regulator
MGEERVVDGVRRKPPKKARRMIRASEDVWRQLNQLATDLTNGRGRRATISQAIDHLLEAHRADDRTICEREHG